jgi:hypothetical protein
MLGSKVAIEIHWQDRDLCLLLEQLSTYKYVCLLNKIDFKICYYFIEGLKRKLLQSIFVILRIIEKKVNSDITFIYIIIPYFLKLYLGIAGRAPCVKP